jgi:hypothetical protein
MLQREVVPDPEQPSLEIGVAPAEAQVPEQGEKDLLDDVLDRGGPQAEGRHVPPQAGPALLEQCEDPILDLRRGRTPVVAKRCGKRQTDCRLKLRRRHTGPSAILHA